MSNDGDRRRVLASDIGLLFLRVTAPLMLAAGHGYSKLANLGTLSATFADPLGIGSTASLALTIFGELFCSLLVVIGLGTRVAAIPPLITMLVATFLVHTHDPWAKKEFALLYAIPFATLALTGAGRFSLDAILGPRLAARLAGRRAQ